MNYRIAKLREARGLSQQQLAEKIGMSQGTIAMWETDKRRIPDDKLILLADFFNVTTDYILGRNGISDASEKEQLDIEKAIHDNVAMLYGGIVLTDEDKQKLEQTLRLVFWDKLNEKKNKKE